MTSSRERALIKQRCERPSYKGWRGVKGSVLVRKAYMEIVLYLIKRRKDIIPLGYAAERELPLKGEVIALAQYPKMRRELTDVSADRES